MTYEQILKERNAYRQSLLLGLLTQAEIAEAYLVTLPVLGLVTQPSNNTDREEWPIAA